jgi:hypothetical protein
MSSGATIEQLVAEARYYGDRVALQRAKAYRGAATSGARMRELERALQSAQRRLREARLHEAR